jgi:O-antigen/teichoic acid export membrane protein
VEPSAAASGKLLRFFHHPGGLRRTRNNQHRRVDAITQISAPLISQALKSNSLAKVQELYRKTSIHQMLAGVYIFLGIWCNIDAVFTLIPKGELYQQGKYVVAFLGLSKLIDMATGANAEIIMYSRYYKFSMVTMILLSALTVGTNYLLIPRFGLNGAAMAAALSIFIFTLVKGWFVWVKFRMQPFTIQTLYALLIALVVYFVASLIPAWGSSPLVLVGNILLRSMVITGLFGGFVLVLHVSEEVNATVGALYQKARALVK